MSSTPTSAASVEPSANGRRVQKSVMIPGDLAERLAAQADREERTVAKVVERAIRVYLLNADDEERMGL